MSISKFDLGPTVTISMTQEMLALLHRVTMRPGNGATEEEEKALANFSELAEQTLTYCEEHPDDRGVVHGFSL